MNRRYLTFHETLLSMPPNELVEKVFFKYLLREFPVNLFFSKLPLNF